MTPIPARMHMTQVTETKTVQILTSLHPDISKWWWIGVILKKRLPWVSLK